MTNQHTSDDQTQKPQIHIDQTPEELSEVAKRTAESQMNPAHLANMKTAKDLRSTSNLLDKRALEDNRQQGIRNTSNNHDHESGGK